MLEIIIPILIFAVIIIGLMFLFSKYTEFLARITVNRMKKKIDSGKISDKKLIKLYKGTKWQKDNVIFAILMSGIFYKFYLRVPKAAFAIYEEEMTNRNLHI
ncbi:hypothetical protein [Sebaldella sp. S0638]|uniref:hypothetical protein n=1 Tax=Sebaldella sp. S0638 TaxID=2957809 RepID=UPI00209F9389|nr:hypothetical protein [Sebaldella sp. S0638]MCP1224236.1 hypothetical protein [Sebaldella sp. S0638]